MPPDCAACPAALFSDFFLRQVLKVVQKDFFLRLFRQSGKSSRKRMLMYGKVSQENYVELTAASAIPMIPIAGLLFAMRPLTLPVCWRRDGNGKSPLNI